MTFRRNPLEGTGPFFWVGAGIGGRWLYGVVFDAPAANAGATICYALTVIGPIVLESVFKRRGE